MARNHITQRLYGPAHVLGQHAKMAVKRLANHSLRAVQAGYMHRYLPSASAVILVGDDPASSIYVRNKGEACQYIGIRSIHHQLASDISDE